MLRVGLVRVSVWGRAGVGVGDVCVCVCVCVCVFGLTTHGRRGVELFCGGDVTMIVRSVEV